MKQNGKGEMAEISLFLGSYMVHGDEFLNLFSSEGPGSYLE
jgi:hypothetical protein